MSGDVTVQADALIHEIVRLTGSDENECRTVAEHLVGANLSGHDSHGVQMIPNYIRNFERGLLVANAPVECVRDDGPFLQFDGNQGYGQRVAADVIATAIKRTRNNGRVRDHVEEFPPHRACRHLR